MLFDSFLKKSNFRQNLYMKTYGIDELTIEDIIAILENPKHAALNDEARAKILKSEQNVREIVESDRTVYGINTGFGPLCDVKIS